MPLASAFAVSLGASAQQGEHDAAVAEPSATTASMVVLGTSTVTAAGASYQVRRAGNDRGSLVLVRNHTSAPLAVSLAGTGKPVPVGGVVTQRCQIGRSAYPIVVASEQGDVILNEQARCGDSLTLLTEGRPPPEPLEVINGAWAPPPGESALPPLDGPWVQ